MSFLNTFKKVKNAERVIALSDLAKVHAVIREETDVHTSLTGFLKEYTVKKVLQGKKVSRNELVNQNTFVGTIVSAESLQRQKLEKLAKIAQQRSDVLVVKDRQLSIINTKLSTSRANQRLQLEISEAQQNLELYNSSRGRNC